MPENRALRCRCRDKSSYTKPQTPELKPCSGYTDSEPFGRKVPRARTYGSSDPHRVPRSPPPPPVLDGTGRANKFHYETPTSTIVNVDAPLSLVLKISIAFNSRQLHHILQGVSHSSGSRDELLP
jgi:hypothetical protein